MAELGAPVELTEEEKRRLGLAPTTSPVFDAAATASTNLLGAPTSEADRTRMFEYRASPFLDAAKKQKDLTNKYYESQGLRWSGGPGGRYNALNELEGQTWKNIGESVMVPQIETEQANRRANIQLAAGIGGQQFSQGLAGREQAVGEIATLRGLGQADVQLQNQALQFAQNLNLSQDQFAEAVRQFNTGRTDQVDQFAQTYGLDLQKLNESIRQYNDQALMQNTQIQNQANQFAESLNLNRDQFNEAMRQFDAGRTDQLDQFAKTYNLDKDKLMETLREFDAEQNIQLKAQGLAEEIQRGQLKLGQDELSQRQTQFADQLQVTKDQFAEAVRQYDLGHTDQLDQFAQTHNLNRDQLDETIRQFDRAQDFAEEMQRGNASLEYERLEAQKDQFAQSLNLTRDQFDEAKIQFDQGRWDQVDQFAQTHSLNRDQLNETIRQFDQAQQIAKDNFAKSLGITERQTLIQELNAQMERAAAWGEISGEYVDPVTHETRDTLQKKRDALDEKVKKAIQLGYWEDTNEYTIAAAEIYADLGLDPKGFLGPGLWTSGGTNAAAGAGRNTEEHETLLADVQVVTPVAQKLKIDIPQLLLVYQGVKANARSAFMAWVQSGTQTTVGELRKWFDGPQTLIQFSDLVDADPNGEGDSRKVWLKGSTTGGATGGGTGTTGGTTPPSAELAGITVADVNRPFRGYNNLADWAHSNYPGKSDADLETMFGFPITPTAPTPPASTPAKPPAEKATVQSLLGMPALELFQSFTNAGQSVGTSVESARAKVRQAYYEAYYVYPSWQKVDDILYAA